METLAIKFQVSKMQREVNGIKKHFAEMGRDSATLRITVK